MIISLIRPDDNPHNDTGRLYISSFGGAPSPWPQCLSATASDSSAYGVDDPRPSGIPRYYIEGAADMTTGAVSGDLVVKRLTDAQLNATAAHKTAIDDIEINRAMIHQRKIDSLKALKSDAAYSKVSNTKIDARIAAEKSKRDA